MPTSKALVFFTTFRKREDAEHFAHFTVSRKLAACVNIFPQVTSYYIWEGKQNIAAESLVMGKTTPNAFKKLKLLIKDLHPYEEPELIAFTASDALPAYLKWIKTTCD